MGLTFSLASFACVGPFVGTLLAASVSGGKTRPLIGMVSFATGLALPFFLLAVFPSYLKRMPRSGGWMARVKVVMGFIILAASLKYLSSLDQVLQLGWITRERFLAAWIVLFAMAGLYLLGFLRLEGIKAEETMGLGRLLSGIALLIFAISLLPGMFGGKLGDLDAYVPLGSQSAGIGGSGGESAMVWMKNQYREALDRARREGKLVLVNFTGYACTNCHWMKANMFTRPEIAATMKNFVLVELYTDGTDAESEANQKVQLAKFNTVAIPYYAIVDPEEKVLATFPGSTGDSAEYLAFLNKPAPPAAVTAAAPAAANSRHLGCPRHRNWQAAVSIPRRFPARSWWSISGPRGACPAFRRSPASTNCTRTSPRRASPCLASRWMKRAPRAYSHSSRSTRWITPWVWAAKPSTRNTISMCCR